MNMTRCNGCGFLYDDREVRKLKNTCKTCGEEIKVRIVRLNEYSTVYTNGDIVNHCTRPLEGTPVRDLRDLGRWLPRRT